jgi:hypothetical protein
MPKHGYVGNDKPPSMTGYGAGINGGCEGVGTSVDYAIIETDFLTRQAMTSTRLG